MLELLGLLGGALFAFAAWPAAIDAIKCGRTHTPTSICWSIFVGCICLFSYLFLKHGFNPTLTAVYGVETAAWGILLYYRHFPSN